MANRNLPPYKGHPSAEVLAFEHGTDSDTMSPEGVWECTVTHDDLASAAANTTAVLTFGAVEDGDFVTVFYGATGNELARVETTRAGGSPATEEDMAAQHAADITALIATSLAGTLASATEDGDTVLVVGLPGIQWYAAPEPAPGSASLTAEHTVSIDLNALQPYDAFPAYALRGESPVLRVLEAWPAGAVATLDNDGAPNTDVLALVALDATGWRGDTGTALGDAHKTEAGWTPTLTLHLGEDPIATTGELKVQVTHSPLPE